MLSDYAAFSNPATQTAAVASLLLLWLRLMPIAWLAPFFGLPRASGAVRFALGSVFAMCLWPLAYASQQQVPASPLSWLLLAARELSLGTTFALATALPLYALQWSGELIDTWRGASLGAELAPSGSGSTQPLGSFFLLFGIAVFVASGGHRVAMGIFAQSLVEHPPLAMATDVDLPQLADGLARLVGQALLLAAVVALPFAAALLLAELALGLFARLAPQFPAFFVGMPLRAAIPFAVLLLVLSLLVDDLVEIFAAAMRTAKTLLK